MQLKIYCTIQKKNVKTKKMKRKCTELSWFRIKDVMCCTPNDRKKEWAQFGKRKKNNILCDLVPLQVDTQKQFSVTLQPYLYAFVHIARLLFEWMFVWVFVPKRPVYLLIEMVYTIHVSETAFLTWPLWKCTLWTFRPIWTISFLERKKKSHSQHENYHWTFSVCVCVCVYWFLLP